MTSKCPRSHATPACCPNCHMLHFTCTEEFQHDLGVFEDKCTIYIRLMPDDHNFYPLPLFGNFLSSFFFFSWSFSLKLPHVVTYRRHILRSPNVRPFSSTISSSRVVELFQFPISHNTKFQSLFYFNFKTTRFHARLYAPPAQKLYNRFG